jgi:DNA-binding GntR family transcriptional regulator
MQKLWRSVRQEMELWLGSLHDVHQRKTRQTLRATVTAHELLLESLQTESPMTCERLMREHIQGWREWLPDLPGEF